MNTLKVIVFFIFFSHINTLFSQKNNIIPTPIEQTINSGYMEIENSPEIIAYFELNSAATLFKNAVKKLELDNDKQTKNRIVIMPGSGISKNNLTNFELFKEVHGSFKDEINSNGFKLC